MTASIESDNHADTWCFGPNFVMDSFTGQTCSVSGYDKKVNNNEVRIGTGLTIWTDPTSGKLHLLQVNQGLDMRDIIDHTLANPNQCRSFGISWCDDAWDKNRLLGMHLEDPELLIPFKMNGCFAEFITRTPTEDEIRDLFDDRIELTDHNTWDPVNLSVPRTVSATISSNISAIQRLKKDISPEGLRVCATMERDAGYIEDNGDQRLLAGISTALTDETLLPRIVSSVHIANTTSRNRHCDISPESLSAKLRIGLNTARDTLKVTTQQGIRQAVHPITRRYRTDTMSLKIRRLRATVYTDTGFINTKSLAQNTCYQGYSSDNFIKIIPMRDQKDAPDSLLAFAHDVGAPAELISDHAAMLIGPQCEYAKKARFLNIKQSSCEAHTQRHNKFEGETRLLKRRWKNRMATNDTPLRAWDYALVYESEILSMIARGDDLIPGLEKITGETVDITEYLDFAFWDLVWYGSDMDDGPSLGRWLGVSHRVGSALCYHILKHNGSIESRTTVQHVTQDDFDKPETKARIDKFNEDVVVRLNDTNFKLPEGEAIIYDDIDDVSDNDNLGYIESSDRIMNDAV